MGAIYHIGGNPTNHYYRAIFSDANPPILTIEGKILPGGSQGRFGIWVFGDDIWLAGGGNSVIANSCALRRSIDRGLNWTNEYARMPGTPPEQSTWRPMYGRGSAADGNLWIAGSAAFVNKQVTRSPNPIASSPFSTEVSHASWEFSSIHGVESPTRIWTVRNGGGLSISEFYYFNGSTWVASSKSGLNYRAPATQLGGFFGVWVDGPNNVVYLYCHDNDFPPGTYIFKKDADAPTDPWVEDQYWSGLMTTGPSGTSYGSPRYLHGCQATGALYFFYSGLSNKGSLQRRDPTTGVWTLVKENAFLSGGGRDLFVIDDNHLLAGKDIVKNPNGYFEIGVDMGNWPGGETPMAVWGELEDTLAPYLSNLSPYSGEVGVDPFGNIVLEIHDDGDGVNDATVTIIVNGTAAWTADAEANPSVYAVSKTVLGTGFRYTINPVGMLPPGTTTVEVYAEDNAP